MSHTSKTKDELEKEKLQAEIDKTNAEKEKLTEEKNEIKRRPWERASFYVAIAPVLIAIIAYIFIWRAKWFEGQDNLVKAERTELQMDTTDLGKQQRQLTRDTADLTQKKRLIVDSTNRLLEKNNSLNRKYDSVSREFVAGQVENSQLIDQIRDNKAIEANLTTKITSAQARTIILRDSLRDLNNYIVSKQARLDSLARYQTINEITMSNQWSKISDQNGRLHWDSIVYAGKLDSCKRGLTPSKFGLF
jgi:hypothetical protein